MGRGNAYRIHTMVNNRTRSIRYENIEVLCQLLECTPNDLFIFTEE